MARVIKRAVVDSHTRDLEGAGTLNFRIAKLMSIDGVAEPPKGQRTGDIPADQDIDEVFASHNRALEEEGYGAIDEESMDYVRGVAKVVRTKERVAAARERRQEAETAARLEAEAAFEEAKRREEKAAEAENAKLREMVRSMMAEMQAKA